MRSGIITIIVMMMVSGVMGVMPAGAQPLPASDEVLLRLTQQEMEEDAAGRVAKAHAEAPAKQLNVPAKTVEDLRGAKQGWGEIGIGLGVAQERIKTDPKTFPAMNDALVRVAEPRGQGKGWGQIAQELGFQLGPVVSDVQRARQEMRAEAKKASTAGGGINQTRTGSGASLIVEGRVRKMP